MNAGETSKTATEGSADGPVAVPADGPVEGLAEGLAEGPAEVLYREAPRGYATTWVLAVLLIGGLIFDLVVGSGVAHVLLWCVAFAIVVGADLLATRVAGRRRSLLVTADTVSIAADSIDRGDVVGLAEDDVTTYRVLGRLTGEGSPRGMKDLVLALRDGGYIVVPCRDRAALIDTLGLRAAGEDEFPIRELGPDNLQPDESDPIAEIADRSRALFTVSGMDLPALDPAPDADRPELVVLIAGEPAVGFVRLRLVDTRAHVSDLAVLPGEMRRGIGGRLLEAACAWATDHGYGAVTLTTFADVSWNAPFFTTHGFTQAGKLSPELEAIRAREATVGLDRVAPRVVMVRTLA